MTKAAPCVVRYYQKEHPMVLLKQHNVTFSRVHITLEGAPYYTHIQQVSQYRLRPTLGLCNNPHVLDRCARSTALPSTDTSFVT